MSNPSDDIIIELVYRSLAAPLEEGEALMLEDWLSVSERRRDWYAAIRNEDRLTLALRQLTPEADSATRAVMLEKIQAATGIGKVSALPVHRVHFLKTAWVRYAAAIIILFGIGAYLWNTQQNEKPLITETKPVPVKNDIMPGSNRAVLTLSNGQQVVLDSAASAIINDGTLSIKNTNGQLSYTGNGKPHSPFEKGGSRVTPGNADRRGISYNTMTTPKGGQYQLTLVDGTKVWLNAASSITYPTAFVAGTREVTITGEVYFEVTKNKEKPFIVNVPYLPLAGVAAQRPRVDRERTEGYRITVLGTSFNVNAYSDEPFVKTSLLEGAVKIGDVFIRPGEAYQNGSVTTTDLDRDLAWKNGSFSFSNASLERVMREISRWYDVDLVYTRGVPKVKLGGSMDRNLVLSEVLTFLRGMKLNCRLEGRKLIIDP